jgi:citrate lyase subunit beta / citryl-CoA lyase
VTPAQISYRRHKSFLEVPIVNDVYWPKIPRFTCDGVMLDLEDSVPLSLKEQARRKLADILDETEVIGGKTPLIRVNNLGSGWGNDDLRMLGRHPANLVICYPKLESVGELTAAAAIVTEGGRNPLFHVMIESYRGLRCVDEILAMDCVVGVHFGYIDYGLDAGCRIFSNDGDDLFTPALTTPRAQIAASAASRGILSTGGSLIPDFRDLTKVGRFVRSWRDNGYTGCIAVSPTHLQTIHDNIGPSTGEIDHAKRVKQSDPSDRGISFIDRMLAEQTMRKIDRV